MHIVIRVKKTHTNCLRRIATCNTMIVLAHLVNRQPGGFLHPAKRLVLPVCETHGGALLTCSGEGVPEKWMHYAGMSDFKPCSTSRGNTAGFLFVRGVKAPPTAAQLSVHVSRLPWCGVARICLCEHGSSLARCVFVSPQWVDGFVKNKSYIF